MVARLIGSEQKNTARSIFFGAAVVLTYLMILKKPISENDLDIGLKVSEDKKEVWQSKNNISPCFYLSKKGFSKNKSTKYIYDSIANKIFVGEHGNPFDQLSNLPNEIEAYIAIVIATDILTYKYFDCDYEFFTDFKSINKTQDAPQEFKDEYKRLYDWVKQIIDHESFRQIHEKLKMHGYFKLI